MQQPADIKTHPLYPYAEFAANAISQRFPKGAGNRVDKTRHASGAEIFENMIKFIKFSALDKPNAQDFAGLIAGLTSGSSDILTSYALGSLRLQFPEKKSLFHCVYINQNVPNQGATTGLYQQTHALLVIGDPSQVKTETLFRTASEDILICDLWLENVYSAKDFYRRRAAEALIQMHFIWYDLVLDQPIGLYLSALRPLHGEVHLFSSVAVDCFFQILEDFVRQDGLQAAKPSSAYPWSLRVNNLSAQSVFALRDAWEKDNRRTVGYVTDSNGICHTIRRLGNTQKYSYWNPETLRPTLITFKKNQETGQYWSHLGVLSTTPQTNSAECHSDSTYQKQL